MSTILLSLNDLYSFFIQNNIRNFSAEDEDAEIVVYTLADLELGEGQDSGLLPVKLKSCHDGENVNHTEISEESYLQALPSLKNRPILGYIHEPRGGEITFGGHNMRLVNNRMTHDGTKRMHYDERVIGIIPSEAKVYFQEEDGRKYLIIENGLIYEDYGNEAADIIRRDKSIPVSIEIKFKHIHFDDDSDIMHIDEFYFNGITCLGKDKNGKVLNPAMVNSELTLAESDDSEEGQTYSIDPNNQEGGQQVDQTENTLEFEETVETTVTETIETNPESTEVETSEETVVEASETYSEGTSTETETEETGEEAAPQEESATFSAENMSLGADEMSLEDIRRAIHAELDKITDYSGWVCDVYSNSFVYRQNWRDGKYQKKSYTVSGRSVTLGEDIEEVFPCYLTQAEKDGLANMKANFSALEEYKENAEKEKKESLLSGEFSGIKDADATKALVANMANFSVEDFAKELKAIAYDSDSKTEKKKNTVRFSVQSFEETAKNPYGRLFDEN